MKDIYTKTLSVSRAYIKRLYAYARANLVVSGVVSVVVIGALYGLYTTYFSTSTETTYVLGEVKRGVIAASLSGSGQVSASNQLELKPDVSGKVVTIPVVAGTQVKAGQLIVQLDTSAAQKAVRDAEANLESAKIALQKLLEPADTLSKIQAENALAQSKSSLSKSYDDGFNTVSNAFLDLPTIMTGLSDILNVNEQGGSNRESIAVYADTIQPYDANAKSFKEDAEAKYAIARTAYEKTFTKYKNTSRTASSDEVEALILESYETTKHIADAVKSMSDLFNFVEDNLQKRGQPFPTSLSTEESLLATYTGDSNSHLLALLNIKDSIVAARYSVAEKEESLKKLIAGTDSLDLASQKLTVVQRENALRDARETLSDSFIRAPFDGVVASVSVKRYDSVGSGTAVATLVTDQKIAELSLNEVDAARVASGDTATLTFDALEDLTLTGKVIEIDAIGTVTQGVVSYALKIGFDSQDERVKAGMTVNASVVSEEKKDVLIVPASAVKTQGGKSYVQVFNPPLPSGGSRQGVTSDTLPEQVEVEVGISSDTEIEIVRGLKEGEQIVVRTTTGSAAANTTTTGTGGGGFRGPGGGIRL